MKLLTFWTFFDLKFSKLPLPFLHMEEIVYTLLANGSIYALHIMLCSTKRYSLMKSTRGENSFWAVLNGSMETLYDESSKLKG